MESMLAPQTGLWLMFMLGLRHGFDPDHIAMIDSMAYRSLEARPRLTPWMGSLFALGHGLAVTAVAVILGAFAGEFDIPWPLRGVLDCLPTVLLLLVGTLNLRDLIGAKSYRPRGWKGRFVPAALRESSHPLAIVAVGALFAMVFDTATQAATWGYAAAADSGHAMALFAGLAFTAGMVVTDTVDGNLMARLLRKASGRADAQAYRRRIGWLVVMMSYAMAVYAIASALQPGAQIGDLALTTTGCLLVLALLFAYVRLACKRGGRPASFTME